MGPGHSVAGNVFFENLCSCWIHWNIHSLVWSFFITQVLPPYPQRPFKLGVSLPDSGGPNGSPGISLLLLYQHSRSQDFQDGANPPHSLSFLWDSTTFPEFSWRIRSFWSLTSQTCLRSASTSQEKVLVLLTSFNIFSMCFMGWCEHCSNMFYSTKLRFLAFEITTSVSMSTGYQMLCARYSH